MRIQLAAAVFRRLREHFSSRRQKICGASHQTRLRCLAKWTPSNVGRFFSSVRMKVKKIEDKKCSPIFTKQTKMQRKFLKEMELKAGQVRRRPWTHNAKRKLKPRGESGTIRKATNSQQRMRGSHVPSHGERRYPSWEGLQTFSQTVAKSQLPNTKLY